MHAARLENSARLQRLRSFLADGLWHSTREIVHGAEVMAVNSAVSELRENGFTVECKQQNRYYWYRLIPEQQRLIA